MPAKSAIEWTEVTWNPVTGCTKMSRGCQNCYAERLARRLQAMGQPRYAAGFRVSVHKDLVTVPMTWQKPRIVFVNSMSDLFHEAVPDSFIQSVFDTMRACPQHVFQILTKRSRRLRVLAPRLPWPGNVWIGVTVEDREAIARIVDLAQVPARVRFLSCEPLLEPLGTLPLSSVEWIIVGGESGPRARPMQPAWVEDILDQCRCANVPFFFKQWGGFAKARAGRTLHGRIYEEWPRGATAPRDSAAATATMSSR
jgi:protein gp37